MQHCSKPYTVLIKNPFASSASFLISRPATMTKRQKTYVFILLDSCQDRLHTVGPCTTEPSRAGASRTSPARKRFDTFFKKSYKMRKMTTFIFRASSFSSAPPPLTLPLCSSTNRQCLSFWRAGGGITRLTGTLETIDFCS